MTVVIFVLLAAVVIGAAWWSRATRGDYCSPFSIVVGVWCGTLALFLLRLLPYQPVSTRAATAMGLGVGCLLAGILAGERLSRDATPSWWADKTTIRWLMPYAGLALAGMLWFVWLVDQHLGWRALIGQATDVRVLLGAYIIPSRYLFLQFFCIVTPLLAVALRLGGFRLRWWHWTAVAACVASTWGTTDRTQFFVVLLTSAFMFLYHRGPELRLARLLGALVLVVSLLGVNFLLVGYWVGKSPDLLGTSAWFPGKSDGGARDRLRASLVSRGSTLYLYATGSFAALSVWTEQDRPRTFGLEVARPLARALDRLGLLPVKMPSSIPENSVVARKGETAVWFNAYTFLYYPMHDFGIPGVVVYCLLIGGLSGAVYERTRRARTSPLHLLVLGQISTALTLSVFVNKFNNTASWYVLVMTVAPFLVPRAARALRQRLPAGRPSR